jgi:CHASE2 domain-containing sensor protein
VRALALLLAALCSLALAGFAPGVMRGLEERVGDVLWRIGPASAPADAEERRFVVVDIDEASVSKLGRGRGRANGSLNSRRLAALGAGTQIFDVVFSERAQAMPNDR